MNTGPLLRCWTFDGGLPLPGFRCVASALRSGGLVKIYLLRFGRCVSAEPDEVLVDLLELVFLRDLAAAEAAPPDVTFLGAFRCDSADPAADFAALLDPLLLRAFDAAEAERLPVTSLFLAIVDYLGITFKVLSQLHRRCIVQNQECDDR